MSTSDIARNRATARREREREIVAATRRVFDERGIQDAPIEEIANGVGINKALIYRHFTSKEELFVAALVDYLHELRDLFAAAEVAPDAEPLERLRAQWTVFIDFGLRYPAFLDCALSLLRRPAGELAEIVSEGVWLRLGQGMGELLGPLAETLAQGAERGVFAGVSDPDYMVSQLWAQTLGTLHLARGGASVRRGPGGVPQMFPIAAAQVREGCMAATIATVVG
jgi:AcrR family transcriptional regulator